MTRKDLGPAIVFLSIFPFIYYGSALPGFFDLESYIWVFVLLSLGYVVFPWMVIQPPERLPGLAKAWHWIYMGWVDLSIVLYFVLGREISALGVGVVIIQMALSALIVLHWRARG